MSRKTIKEKHRRLLREQTEKKSFKHYLNRLRHPKPVSKDDTALTPKRQAAKKREQ